MIQLRIDMRQLIDGVFDTADVLQLTAGVAMHEFQTIEHVTLLEGGV